MRPPARRGRDRVTAEHVGQRVSVRRLVDDDERGRVASDVVGRLVEWTDDAMVVVDRSGHGHRVERATVVAARPVPEHPVLPPEPGQPIEPG